MITLRALYAAFLVFALAAMPCQAAPRVVEGVRPEAEDIDAFARKALARVGVVPGLSVTVVKGSDVVMTAGYGVADLRSGKAVDADTGFYIASSTKAFTALSIAAMAERGMFSLEAPLNTWIGKSPLPADLAASISLNDLLSHRSGLENAPITFRAAYSGASTPRIMSHLLADTRRGRPYGTFRYANTGYNLATTLIEDRFGRDWRTMVDKEVLGPVGMRHTTAWIGRRSLASGGAPAGAQGTPDKEHAMTKHWFITGISRGLGLALAQAVLARGDTVVGTVRSGAPVIEAGPGRLHVLILDVTDGAAIDRAVDEAFRLAGGRLDVVVNNAGYGLLGALEDATDAEVERLFATDVFGPFKVIRAALPRLRAQGEARILNITSIAGRAPGAASALYAAAKYALEGMTASLHQEVAPLGVKLTAVAPGAFRTDFLSAHSIRLSETRAAGYDATVGAANAAFSSMAGQQLGDPDRAAEALLRIVDAPDPPLHLLLGSDALRRARAKLAAVEAEIGTWEDLTISTDFPDA